MKEHFGDVLRIFVEREGRTAGQLEKLTQVPKQTIVSWLEGRVKHPRSWSDIVRVAAALHLNESETNRLLGVSRHGTIQELTDKAQSEQDDAALSLLSPWQKPPTDKPISSEPSPLLQPFLAPPNISGFVGRDDLIQNLTEVVLQDGQICVLYGMGGVGKTAVALQMAYNLRHMFPDGVLWANLERATDDKGHLNENVLNSILSAFAQGYGLDVREEEELNGRSAAVRNLLANKRALIILDNAHSSEDVFPLIPPSTSPCSLLITTRNRQTATDLKPVLFEVNPLSERENLALLQDIVGQQRINAELPGAVRIVELVGGLPLAVKVIAGALAETESLTLLEYCELLMNESLRQAYQIEEEVSKEVRASFEMSYGRLPDDLKMIFTALGVFAGTDFSEEAVSAVVDMPLALVKRKLSRLDTLSLIEPGGSVESLRFLPDQKSQYRYRLHPLLRQFAREKLALVSDAETYHQRVTNYFINYAHANGRRHHLLDEEWEDIRSALNWLNENKNWEHLYVGLTGLTDAYLGVIGYLDARGYWQIAIEWLEILLPTPIAKEDLYTKAELLFKVGAFAWRQANTYLAEAYLNQSWALIEMLPDSEKKLFLLAHLGEFMAQIDLAHGELQQALLWSERSIKALQSLNVEEAQHEQGYQHIRRAPILARIGERSAALDGVLEGLALLPVTATSAQVSGLMSLGILNDLAGQTDKALSYWEEGVSLAAKLGDNRRLAGLWQNIGVAKAARGQINEAIHAYEKSLYYYEQINDVGGIAFVHSNLGFECLSLGDYDAAFTHITHALAITQQHQLAEQEVYALVNQARWYVENDRLDQAEFILSRAENLGRQLSLLEQQREISFLKAEISLRQGDYQLALGLVEEALLQTDNAVERGIGERLKGHILQTAGRLSEAESTYQSSLSTLNEQNVFEHAKTQLALGSYYVNSHAYQKARHYLQAALIKFQSLQAEQLIEQSVALLRRVETDQIVISTGSSILLTDLISKVEEDTRKIVSARFVRGDLLAVGGQGEVYLGLDRETGEQVVIKHLRAEIVSDDPLTLQRFKDEAEILQRLNHPNIVDLLAVQETEAGYEIVMEYVPGGTLQQLLMRHPQLPLPTALNIVLELADALSRTHHLNIIHRDLKPGNVLLAVDGTPRLTDFGIARIGRRNSGLTQTDTIMGTIPYMSPEAFGDKPDLDARTDIWSFGVILFEMLGGELPFNGTDLTQIIVSILNHAPPDLAKLRQDIPLSLILLIESLLDKDRSRRISRMRQVAAELEAIRDDLPDISR